MKRKDKIHYLDLVIKMLAIQEGTIKRRGPHRYEYSTNTGGQKVRVLVSTSVTKIYIGKSDVPAVHIESFLGKLYALQAELYSQLEGRVEAQEQAAIHAGLGVDEPSDMLIEAFQELKQVTPR